MIHSGAGCTGHEAAKLHLIVEAHRAPALTSGIKGLSVRIARGLNAKLGRRGRGWIDPCCSGRFFDGWRDFEIRSPPGEEPSVSAPHSWLLSTGWKLRGRISVNEVPGTG